jgi:DNA-binding CsgD family transcriptional regulator
VAAVLYKPRGAGSIGTQEAEHFVDELPAALRDAARRGLAWLEADGLRVCKLNSVGAAWLAQFYPPGVRGSRLPERLHHALGGWQHGGLQSGPLSGRVESPCGRLVVRAFSDSERRGVLLVLDLLPSLDVRLALHGMTSREIEVFRWMARGKTDPEIAVILGTRPRTIEKHVEHILAKLGVENRTTAVLVGIQDEL